MKISFTILFMLITLFIFSQNVKGVVIDKKTKKPISGVSVFEKNSKIGTITNSNGYFYLILKNKDVQIIFEDKRYIKNTIHCTICNDTTIKVNLVVTQKIKHKKRGT